MPYGTGCSPYDGPKSGCRSRSVDMCASHWALLACTGSALTSACQYDAAGNTGQSVPGGGLGPPEATPEAGARRPPTRATTRALRRTDGRSMLDISASPQVGCRALPGDTPGNGTDRTRTLA